MIKIEDRGLPDRKIHTGHSTGEVMAGNIASYVTLADTQDVAAMAGSLNVQFKNLSELIPVLEFAGIGCEHKIRWAAELPCPA